MVDRAARGAAIALLLALVRSASQAESVASGDGATVSTYAGTGVSGNRDGPLASATFGSPSGLAVGKQGEIFVVDKALNTLRVIADGTVRTLVGTQAGDPVLRKGDYRDGPLAIAAFNHPEGVAVAPDGSVIVADTLNLAVRRVKDGAVTTISGAPGRWGSQDGPAATASFKAPVGVAVDADGNIFVADEQNGVREISRQGIVGTVRIPDVANTTAVAIGAGPDPQLYVADETGLVAWDLAKGGEELRFSSASPVREFTKWPEAHVPLGHPYALAADGRYGVAFTDVSNNSIRRLEGWYARELGGDATYDPNRSGGYVDGKGSAARFFAPLAIAKVSAGWLVADAGNHRLRLVSNVDDRQPIAADGRRLDEYYSGTRRSLALIGDSQVWFDTDYAESIAGQLHELMPGFDVLPIALTGAENPEAIAEYCNSLVFPLQKVVLTVYLFDDSGIRKFGAVGYDVLRKDNQWQLALTAQLTAARKTLGASASRFTIVFIPAGYEASPNEVSFMQQTEFTKASNVFDDINDLHQRVTDTLTHAGFDLIDAWSDFRNADRDGSGPLFGPFDAHLAPKGRALLAKVIYAHIRQRHDLSLR